MGTVWKYQKKGRFTRKHAFTVVSSNTAACGKYVTKYSDNEWLSDKANLDRLFCCATCLKLLGYDK